MTIAILFIAMNSSAQVTDKDGNNYKTVKIGTPEWMAENLDVSHFRNGDIIPEAEDAAAWQRAGEAHQPAWCYAEPNDPVSVKRFHKLYNWYAVHDSRGLAPNGWHVPSTSLEWADLTEFLGGEDMAGGKMKSTRGWNNGNGTNESGFAGLPGGLRYANGTFEFVGSMGYWWSSSDDPIGGVWGRYLDASNSKISRWEGHKESGLSVRCVKD